MPFWVIAAPGRWHWLFGAYALWGGFAVVNISGRNLMLKLAPRSDNSAHIALFRQVGGLLAGVSGLIGGFWLDDLLAAFDSAGWTSKWFGGFQLVFLISFVGRLTAALWVLPIQERKAKTVGWMWRVGRRWRRRQRRQPE